MAVAFVVGVLAVAATSAAATDFTWAGAAAVGTPAWSNSTNWGGAAPSGTVGTLDFPKLASAACTAVPPTATCYASNNDVTGLNVNAITLDDGAGNNGFGYNITGSAITLGAGGLTASTASGGLLSFFRVPLTLSAPQTWSIDDNALFLYDGTVGGGSNALTINTAANGELDIGADIEAGTVTLGGTVALVGDRTNPEGQLNGMDGNPVNVDDSILPTASAGGNSRIGPFTSVDSLVQIGDVAPGEGGFAGVLTVNGGATFDAFSTLGLAYGGPGTTPGTDYSQLSASGPVDLGGATLQLFGSVPSGGGSTCVSLNHGDVNTLVTTTGSLTGTFNGVPDGTVVAVGCAGAPGTSPMVRINYTPNSVTATVVSGSSTPPPPPPPNATRPSATQVNCLYTIADGTDSCAAQVADAGPQPTTTPTGNVTFSSQGGGVFEGDTCQLQQTPFSPGVSSCTVTFLPPSTQFPQITASYAGDSTHAPSTGQSAFLVLGGSVNYSDPQNPAALPPTDPSQCQDQSAQSASAAATQSLGDKIANKTCYLVSAGVSGACIKGMIAAFVAGPETAGISEGVALGLAIVCGVSTVVLVKLFTDPPDSHYTALALPSGALRVSLSRACGRLGRAPCRRLRAALSTAQSAIPDLTRYANALYTSGNRLNTARSAGSHDGIALQIAAVKLYSGKVADDLDRVHRALLAIAPLLPRHATVSAAQLRRSAKADRRHPPAVLRHFSSLLGVSASVLAQALQGTQQVVGRLHGAVSIRRLLTAGLSSAASRAYYRSTQLENVRALVRGLAREGAIGGAAGNTLLSDLSCLPPHTTVAISPFDTHVRALVRAPYAGLLTYAAAALGANPVCRA